VDATRFMPTASPAEVAGAVLECLRVAAPGGGYVLATDHSFHAGIPLENVYAFIRGWKEAWRLSKKPGFLKNQVSGKREPE
jgi:uroporphyrinogen-III decarboxylase